MARYNMWGIRFDDREFQIGEELPKSRRWEDGIETNEELNGTCALYVSDETDFLEYLDGELEADCGELDKYNEAIENNNNYAGKHIYLVAIESRWGYEYGEDEGEVILNGAEVVRVIR